MCIWGIHALIAARYRRAKWALFVYTLSVYCVWVAHVSMCVRALQARTYKNGVIVLVAAEWFVRAYLYLAIRAHAYTCLRTYRCRQMREASYVGSVYLYTYFVHGTLLFIGVVTAMWIFMYTYRYGHHVPRNGTNAHETDRRWYRHFSTARDTRHRRTMY